ncbi:ATPase, T2SS/T4P/T4SS family [soil metagenome]
MYTVTVTSPDGQTSDVAVDDKHAFIGRGKDCTVRLAGWRSGREHARLSRTSKGVFIEDLGNMTGTWINGSRVVQHGPLDFGDEIHIAGYKLRVKAPVLTAPPRDGASDAGRLKPSSTTLVQSDMASSSQQRDDIAGSQSRFVWRKRVHELLLETIDLRRRDLARMSDEELRVETQGLIREIIDGHGEIPTAVDRIALGREVLDEAVGLGPLEDLLADDTVSEIMVNQFDEIFVERAGRLQRHPLAFTSDRAVLGVIERIVAPLGRRIDESSPMVDARLKDGSRVNAIIAPLALKGPTLTIRKFMKKRLGIDELVRFGSISQPMAAFLRLCVVQRKNLLVSGGTGTGKTSFLNVLSNFIPDGERIVTIEDAAELKLDHSHLVSLESRPANVEGRGQVAIRDLVRNSLRMRPDRVVVGECRGGEALDMLQAMNTGHDGSLTTLHANSPRDALARLETLVLMAGMDLPLSAIREQIAAAVDIVVQQTRYACGARNVSSITEITGIETGKIQMQELFRFEQRCRDADGKTLGSVVGCDAVPSFYDELRERGAALDLSIFSRESA